MKSFYFIVFAILSLPTDLCGQIFADFTVRQGAVPLGTFRARLDYDKAPRVCANFISLATGKRPWIDVTNGATRTNTPFYNGLTFHRLIHNFVIQGGSRNGLGTDGPGYTFLDQYHPQLRHSGRYILSMAKSGQPNTNGSQFFITLAATPELDDKHSVFGEVITNRQIIDNFTQSSSFPTNAQDRPVTPIVMDSVTISGPSALLFDIEDPALRLPNVQDGVRLTPFRNAAASQFAITFDRKFQTNYQIFYSQDLSTWTFFRNTLNINPVSGGTFTTTGLNLPKFFMRVAPVSYENIPNAPPDLTAVGKTLKITDRSGNQLTLTFNGAGGGTWTDGMGNAGSLSAVSWSDLLAASGVYTDLELLASKIAVGVLNVNFSPPAGPESRTSLRVFVSFHTPTTGYLEETGSAPARYEFVWTP